MDEMAVRIGDRPEILSEGENRGVIEDVIGKSGGEAGCHMEIFYRRGC